jgi:hypothetical protein
MSDARLTRRLAALLHSRLFEARLDQVADTRDPRGKRWGLGTLLDATVISMCAGAKSTAEAEDVTDALSPGMRRWLAIPRRIPDTTLRDRLCSIEPQDVVPCLHALVRAAHRRKALVPDELPFGVASMDGKGFSLPSADDWYAQRQTHTEAGPLLGVVRTVTVTLTSSRARPCIDVTPIPAHTNEMGVFQQALEHLVRIYGGLDLFRLVTYDAGACSAANASAVRRHRLHYLFGLKSTQATLYQEAERWLGTREPGAADATTEDKVGGNTVVRRIFLGAATAAQEGWEHLSTVMRVETETLDASGTRTKVENRYFISSLASDRLTPKQWMLLIRRHWGVETTHQVLDVSLEEDDHPWIEANPRAALVVSILRRIAYTLLALYRSVTQRSDLRRQAPWNALLCSIYLTLVTATPEHLSGLRRRSIPALS